ncbi:MAG: hypothetical protein ACI8TX_003616, partial [Hyphomicrobiaceae bacterium]
LKGRFYLTALSTSVRPRGAVIVRRSMLFRSNVGVCTLGAACCALEAVLKSVSDGAKTEF